MRYINRCTDETPPEESRAFHIPYNIYFAKYTSKWEGAKAFLDISKPGFAYGRIYKITKEQYEEVKRMEGPDYRQKVDLGYVDDIPVYSFTDTKTNYDNNNPSDKYCNIILDGLIETYGNVLNEETLRKYIEKAKK